MTLSLTISINGNHKAAVTVQHGDEAPIDETISGRGLDHPFVKSVALRRDVETVVTVWPEEEDLGDESDHPHTDENVPSTDRSEATDQSEEGV